MRLDRTALRAVNAMEGGPVSPGELGRRLHLASGSVTALLDRLEGAGHIKRRLSDADRRRRDAYLTPSTRKQAGERYEALARELHTAFAEADNQEIARVTSALDVVATAFVEAARLATADLHARTETPPGCARPAQKVRPTE
jgi:DNA-binding MarR family transcriptional regulator